MACTCNRCGVRYKMDIIVDDALWERIRPLQAAEGGGLLCPTCIMYKIESLISIDTEYSAFTLKRI